MDFAGTQNKDYILLCYAGQAMNGLLANRGVSQSLSSSMEMGADVNGAERLAELAFDIADAMVSESARRCA